MKKTIYALLIAIAIILALGTFYIYKINVFNQDTLKSVDIRTGDFSNPQVYVLDDDQRTHLFNSLSSIVEVDESIPEDAMNFDMTLLNRWDLTKNYRIYFTSTHDIFVKIDNQKALYLIEDPLFFFSHEGFDALYSDQNSPKLSVMLGNEKVIYDVNDFEWQFRRLDGTWTESLASIDITSELDAEITGTETPFGLAIDKLPTNATLKITDDYTSTVVFEGKVNVRQLPMPDYDGYFKYALQLDWDANDLDYRGTASLTIPVEVDLPERFSVSKSIVKQGDMVVVTAQYVNDISNIEVDQTISNKFQWFVSDGILRGYIPTNYNTAVGKYPLTFKNTSTGETYSHELEVVSRDFKVQKLTVDPNVEASTRNDAAYEEFRLVFNPVRTVSHIEKYYTESFVLPTNGRLTTEFGESRTVNGAPTSYRHNGIDIGAPRGADVVATNSGKVVLAYNLILTGNTIIIDHGEGLFSVYEHLDSLNVEKDQMVERGQLIGKVGSTGFSTGPHLHFMISYYDINLEPGYFIFGETLTKENYNTLMNP